MGERTVHLRVCPLCEACAGSRSTSRTQQVALIRPDRDDVWSKGYICPKGTTLGHLHHDPDRLRAPMIRDGETWREATWDEAFARCEELIQRRARAPRAARRSPPTSATRRPTTSRSAATSACSSACSQLPTIYSAGTVDQWPKNVSCMLMYGEHVVDPVARHPAHRLLGDHGRQPAGVAGQPPRRARRARRDRPHPRARRQGRRRRPPSHRHRRPGRRVGPDRARHRRRVPARDRATCCSRTGSSTWATLADLVERPRRRAPRSRPSSRPRRSRPPAASRPRPSAGSRTRSRRRRRRRSTAASGCATRSSARSRRGSSTSSNILTGNFDRPAASCSATPCRGAWRRCRTRSSPTACQFGRWHSRVRGAPEVLGQVPLSCLAEEIATPGEGQLKALVTIAGNPVISAPDAGRLDAALPRARVHDQRRQLPERDDAPRARDPAGPVARSSSPTSTT